MSFNFLFQPKLNRIKLLMQHWNILTIKKLPPVSGKGKFSLFRLPGLTFITMLSMGCVWWECGWDNYVLGGKLLKQHKQERFYLTFKSLFSSTNDSTVSTINVTLKTLYFIRIRIVITLLSFGKTRFSFFYVLVFLDSVCLSFVLCFLNWMSS